jgi:hypothetical protein
MRVALAAATAVTSLALASGCGGGQERYFTAQDFVDQMNQNGASLRLGRVISEGGEDGGDVNAVKIQGTAPSATGEGAKLKPSGAATVLVLGDAEAASDEYGRCADSPGLTCFRAANVLLRVEHIQPTDQAELTTAIEAMAQGS